MTTEILRKRVGLVRKELHRRNVDCLVVTKGANVRYLTGFSGDDSWAVVGRRYVYLVTDSRYTEQADGECSGCKIIERGEPLAKAVGLVLGRMKSVGLVGVESWTSVAQFGALKKEIKGKVKSLCNVIEPVRVIKDSGEIAAIRGAIRIARIAFGRIGEYVKTGVSENSLAGALDFEIRKLGGANSFDTIVAFGSHGSRAHHQGGGRKLKSNDTVLIDFGVRYKGYCCDLTRCFSVGKRSGFYEKVYGVVRGAQAAAIKAVRAGVDVAEVDLSAKEVIGSSALEVYGHGTGHGLGLEVHESPAVSSSGKGKLEAGMVLTIEPGVYIPGRLGVRIEDDVLVRHGGCEVLSRGCAASPFEKD